MSPPCLVLYSTRDRALCLQHMDSAKQATSIASCPKQSTLSASTLLGGLQGGQPRLARLPGAEGGSWECFLTTFAPLKDFASAHLGEGLVSHTHTHTHHLCLLSLHSSEAGISQDPGPRTTSRTHCRWSQLTTAPHPSSLSMSAQTPRIPTAM